MTIPTEIENPTEIEVSTCSSDLLPLVIALGKRHRKTLGFLPNGAFEDYAADRRIIVATTRENALAGYLLYRITRNTAFITHLCVDQSFRGQGIARQLMDRLKIITTTQIGISLTCRRDYHESDVWSHLGFTPIAEKAGRGTKQTVLTHWWYDNGHPDLFSSSEDMREDLPIAVMDANVCFDLDPDCQDATAEESRGLLADWFREIIELCVVPEILNEINRNSDTSQRKRSRANISRFRVSKPKQEKVEMFHSNLLSLFKCSTEAQDRSDVRQLASAIASSAAYFVTRDQGLLDLSGKVFDQYGTLIIRPAHLIADIDQLTGRHDYEPQRVAGTLLTVVRAGSDDHQHIERQFQNFNARELKRDFRNTLRSGIANPDREDVSVIQDHEKKLIAYVHTRRTQFGEVEILSLRAHESPTSPSIVRQLLWSEIEKSPDNINVLRFLDPAPSGIIQQALIELGFLKTGEGWVRVRGKGVIRLEDLHAEISQILTEESDDRLGELTRVARESKDSEVLETLEKMISPMKILENELPCFIVPIQPHWAAALFDRNLAESTLFGVETHPALLLSNAYYRSANTSLPKAPSRILWYVSSGGHGNKRTRYSGTMKIRAASHVDEVYIGPAKTVFSRFRRLGVYDWQKILNLARTPHGEILAFRFSQSELFDSPISFADVQQVLLDLNGKRNPFVAPIQISPEIFWELYRRGIQGS